MITAKKNLLIKFLFILSLIQFLLLDFHDLRCENELPSQAGNNSSEVPPMPQPPLGAAPQNASPTSPEGESEITDPSNTPFRSLRRRQRRLPVKSVQDTRSGFENNNYVINPNPTQKDAENVDMNPPAVKTATGKSASDNKIVIAGPEYNKEKADQVPKDLKPTLVENFEFHEADINDVIKAISKLTKKNFILTKGLRGTITIISPTAISIEDAWRAFLTSLEINDLTTVESGAYLKIVRRSDARYTNTKLYTGNYNPDNDEVITRFVNLKFIDAEEVAETLRDLISRAGGRIFAYSRTNTLIITDSGSNIKRLLKIINEMDVEGFEEKLDIIKVNYASASEIAEKISVIIDQTDDTSGASRMRRTTGFRRPTNSRSASPAEFHGKIIPDDRTNSLLVLATETNLAKLRTLLKKIDIATKTSTSSNIHIHYLKNASSEEVAKTLTGMTTGASSPMGSSRTYTPGRTFGGGTSSGVVKGGFSDSLFSGKISISADKPTNALVIIASQQDYESLKEIIEKLDVRRKQVYVEAIIAEVSIDKSKSLGVSASKVDPQHGIYSFGDSNLNSLRLLSDPVTIFGGAGLTAGFARGEQSFTTGGTGQSAGSTVKVGDLNLIVKAMFGNSDINVLSTPQILTMDNEKATITVGEKIPFVAATTLNQAGSQQNIDRQDVGISLEITPQINETSEYVKLIVNQKADDVSNRVVQGMPANVGPATTTRTANTTVIVRDQELVSIGGLMKDKITESVTKVPLLGDLPLLGWLFRNKNTSVSKTNLLLFIKPTIIGEYSDLRKLYHEKAEERRKFVTKAYGEEDVHQKIIDESDKLKIDTAKSNKDEKKN